MRLQRQLPELTDVTPEELQELYKRRAALNEKLMKLAMGETDCIPLYDYVPLPDTTWAGYPAQAEVEFQDTLSSSKVSFARDLWARKRELESIGVVAGDAAVLQDIMPKWREAARGWLAHCTASAKAHGDLWKLNEFHLLAGLGQLLLEHGLTMAELLKD